MREQFTDQRQWQTEEQQQEWLKNRQLDRQIGEPASSANWSLEVLSNAVKELKLNRSTARYDRFIQLAIIVIKHDFNHGHLKWKVTEVTRLSRISRSRIYEPLGNTKKKMVMCALGMICDEIFEISSYENEPCQLRSGSGPIIRAKKMILDSPELLAFYFCNRTRTCEIGSLIREYENRFRAAMDGQTNAENKSKVNCFVAIMFGLTLTPFFTDLDVQNCYVELYKNCVAQQKNCP